MTASKTTLKTLLDFAVLGASLLIGLQILNVFKLNNFSIAMQIFFASLVAGAISYLLKRKLLFVLLSILFFPALFLGLYLPAATPILGVAIVILFLLYLPTFFSKVPYYPTHLSNYQIIARELPQSRSFKFLDAGCGNAKLLLHLAKHFPDAQFFGVELSPLAFLWAKSKVFLSRLKNIEIKFKSFWKVPFREYDYVYAFLAPPPMESFWDKCKSEMLKGGTVLINSFPMPTTHVKAIDIAGESLDRSGRLYIYRL